LSLEEISLLHWNQESDPDRVVVPPNLLRNSRVNADARYVSALKWFQAWHLRSGARVLDVGCGISEQAEMFRQFSYVGADVNAPRLGFGASRHPWAQYTAQDVTNLGFAPTAFDGVLCLEVIEHLPPAERPALAGELLRVLRPGGLLVMTTPDGRITTAKRVFGSKCERSHERELTRAEVESLLADAGARVIECNPVSNLVQPAGKLAAVLAHLVADRPWWRERLAQCWARAGYRTLLYAATHQ
jgi:2-polyprenyl-3-methyl-5-hydroxy-6-metoxy-1,4-benzoquinol methylase